MTENEAVGIIGECRGSSGKAEGRGARFTRRHKNEIT